MAPAPLTSPGTGLPSNIRQEWRLSIAVMTSMFCPHHA
jgi:hypothetical protein